MSQLIITLPLILPQGAGQGNLGIYIKSIVKGGPAEMVSANTLLIHLKPNLKEFVEKIQYKEMSQ